MKRKLTMFFASLFLMMGTAWAQAPVDSPVQAITGLLNRIGGNGAADLFEIVIDASLAENGKDVFVITSQNSKPCIKGNTQLSVATGINWYLNHYAHINLTWNNLTTDLSKATLPVPGGEEKHVCNAPYRYDFNTCTFSYSMAFWTWERWQQEIDWMALHGINAPLNLVGLEVVTRNFLEELGVSETDIDNYIAGPGFMAWFAMNNLEGWGSTINAIDVTMNGNPDWWYTRQEQLCRNMMQRMRELGMQPVIPGFSGQVPYALNNYTTITGFNKGDIVNAGSWGGGFTHPGVVNPSTDSYKNLADIYYKHLHDVMGISEFYSIDPFHEMTAPVSPNVLYPGIMAHLDRCYALESDEDRARFNAPAQPKWIVQQWQGTPVSGAFSAMSSYGDRFIGLDLFADAPGKAQWNGTYYQGRPYIFCMLHNFGGRSGMHGRLESTMNDYFRALAKNNNCQGIGATPEGSETNPILYDMLFELPWMDVNNRPTVDKWLEDYAYSRYGVQNEKALEALKNLKKSVWACPTDQQGTSEAVILARPKWEVKSVSTWSTSAIYWDPQDVLQAADGLYSIKDIVTENGGQDGVANYNYDFIDVVRQAMVDYAAELLPLIKAAHDKGDNTEYTRLYKLYLQLMLDLDTMLSYDEGFKLERWTSLARNIADEVEGTDVNDRNWLEWNARTQVTVWAGKQDALNDYSNRCWAGLIKDFHYERWKYFFENNGAAPGGNWYSGFERPWTVNFTDYDYSEITIPNDMTATEKAAETFGKYFGRVMGATKNYIFPMGVTRDATKSDAVAEVNRGQVVELPLKVGKDVTITSVWVDLNNDGAASNAENLDVIDGNKVAIAADAAIGKTTVKVTYDDGTVITFGLALVEEITEARAVTAVAGANGSVAIEGTNELSISTTEPVKMTATANTGYNFKDWTDAAGNVVSNDNPYTYYGKEAATFTANFIQNKWGVVACNGTFSGDIASYKQFIHNLTFAYHNREAETILETTTAPTEIFNTISKIVNVPQGASFTVSYNNGSADGLKYCYFRAYIDLNQDGDFDDEGELLKETGTNGAQNTAVCSGSINVLLPYDMPLGITHMRLRFDGAWDNGNKPSGRGAKDASIRPVYELILNVTEFSDKAATINVATNNEAWGTVKVWTNETPADITATEWNVTKGVKFNIAAEKASDDVEFLGWYDQYGRLLTDELEHTMYAREDATYTARFRKALGINGWEFEYRTEPGDELRVKGALGSTAPVGGKMYYIYAKTNAGNYYLYNNNGTLATTTQPNGNAYIWVATADGNYLTFENLAQSGKYIGYGNTGKGLTVNTTPVKLDISSDEAVGGDCVCIKRIGDDADGKYMVTKNDGSEFNRNSKKVSDTWCSDYVFVEITAPDVVILTGVRKSGNHDLVIPETVEILGEQCKVVGFDNNLFNNNKDLWSISLPSTIEEMSNNKVFNTVVKGKGANASANTANYITTDLGTTLAAGEDWSISLTIEDNGNNFNQWGSALIATGNAPMNSTYGKGFQLYLQAGGGLIVKTDADNDANKLTNLTKGSKFRVDIVYTHANTQLKVTATPQTSGTANSLTVTQDMSDFSVVSHAIPEGVNITNLEVRKGAAPDPFKGCSNLLGITVADGCDNYYVENRTLYRIGGIKLHTLADEDKADAIRALGTLIDNTKTLMDVIAASVNPTGKATEITLTTTEGDNNYIWCNNPHVGGNDGAGGVAALLDENAGTYLHSNWSSLSSTHDYLQIDNVVIVNSAGLYDLHNFKIAGQQRGDGSNDRPKNIEIYGSNDKTNWTPITIVEGLPNTAGAIWSSNAIPLDGKYSSLKFVVKTYDNFNQTSSVSRPYFHMAKFDLFKLTSTVEVAAEYQELGGITNDEAANVYDNLVNALYVYNNGGTAEELQAAYDALEPLYTELNGKKNNVLKSSLNKLITATKELLDIITASTNPVGKATEIALSTAEGADYYIWCNNPHTGDNADARGGVAALLDEDPNTYLHTNWSSVSSTHDYLQIDIAKSEGLYDLYNFKIAGQQRADGEVDRPKNIEIYGSNDNSNWTPITTVTGLPNTASGIWSSDAISSDAKYSHLKFIVKTHNNENDVSRPYFHMAKFDLFKLTSTIEVKSACIELGITNEEATAAYEHMVYAQHLCNNPGTGEELEATLNDLQAAYETLKAKIGDAEIEEDLPYEMEQAYSGRASWSETSVFPEGLKSGDASGSHGGPANHIGVDGHTIYKKVTPVVTNGEDLTVEFTYTGGNHGLIILGIDVVNANGDVVKEDYHVGFTGGGQDNKVYTLTDLDAGNYILRYYVCNREGDHDLNNTGGTISVSGAREIAEANDVADMWTTLKAKAESDYIAYKGEGLGYYNNTEDIEAELAATPEETVASYTAAFVALDDAMDSTPFAMPEEGKFYRIKNNGGSGYLNGEGTSGRVQFTKGIDNDANSVFYFIDNKLLSYKTGYYLAAKIPSGKNGNFLCYTETVDESTNITFKKSLAKGKLLIEFDDDDRSFYSAGTGESDAAGSGQTGDNYRFTVEEVTSLPITLSTIGENSWATLYAPVALNVPTGVTAYTGALNDDKTWLTLNEVKGGVIPAETAVILEGTQGGSQNFAITTTETTIDGNALAGTVATKVAPTNEGTIYTLQQKQKKDENGDIVYGEDGQVEYLNSVVFGIYANEDNSVPNLKGFRAYLPISTANPTESIGIRFEGTTDIEHSEIRNQHSEMIFDLMGRRVEAITKGGIYIVNGKKVIR